MHVILACEMEMCFFLLLLLFAYVLMKKYVESYKVMRIISAIVFTLHWVKHSVIDSRSYDIISASKTRISMTHDVLRRNVRYELFFINLHLIFI